MLGIFQGFSARVATFNFCKDAKTILCPISQMLKLRLRADKSLTESQSGRQRQDSSPFGSSRTPESLAHFRTPCSLLALSKPDRCSGSHCWSVHHWLVLLPGSACTEGEGFVTFPWSHYCKSAAISPCSFPRHLGLESPPTASPFPSAGRCPGLHKLCTTEVKGTLCKQTLTNVWRLLGLKPWPKNDKERKWGL